MLVGQCTDKAAHEAMGKCARPPGAQGKVPIKGHDAYHTGQEDSQSSPGSADRPAQRVGFRFQSLVPRSGREAAGPGTSKFGPLIGRIDLNTLAAPPSLHAPLAVCPFSGRLDFANL